MQNFIPVIPDSAPFNLEQRAWLNGFIAGLYSRAPQSAAPGALPTKPAASALAPLTILFGSQTGTAESLAKRAAKEAGKRGFAATVFDMSQIDLARLSAERNVLVITSTYGDGEPPDNAKSLLTALNKAEGALLGTLRFSVCALGDTNYTQFCKCGQEFDSRLEKLGAARVADRAECDLDYDEKFTRWLDTALANLNKAGSAHSAPVASTSTTLTPAVKSDQPSETGYSRKNPFSALLKTSRLLNGDGSAKEVRHVEFDLADSGLVYEAGDALGVVPHNCPELVGEVLALLGFDGEEEVPAPDGTLTSLRHALTAHYDLGKPSPELVSAYALQLATGPSSGQTHLHVIDVLHGNPGSKRDAKNFVTLLKKIQPRLYSISSSPKAHTGEVHLTVGAVRYEASGRKRKGVCSTFLAERAKPGETRVGVFVHSNKAFRPPADDALPMIMVGPGTGIAPFRAFLHERKARKAAGKNWLLFGDQRSTSDFLYREELEALRSEGMLHRLDTAFSRDQAEKVYVQHRMLENASELFAWLESGGHFYVCGDASRMAKDVDAALHQVVEIAGHKTPEQAAEYIEKLKATKRYARDVY